MTRRTTFTALLLGALALTGCTVFQAGIHREKRYSMTGTIQALDPAAKTATIAAGPINGWMDAMTMEYPIKPDGEFQKLHVGDRIQAIVMVEEGDAKYYVTEITVLPRTAK